VAATPVNPVDYVVLPLQQLLIVVPSVFGLALAHHLINGVVYFLAVSGVDVLVKLHLVLQVLNLLARIYKKLNLSLKA